jgi:hypothetical protein
MGFKSILIISDTHFPYNHPDTINFLGALKKKYKPDKVVHIGDEIDGHSISFHASDPDLLSPGDELQTAINRLSPLYKMFPKVDLVESNHGSLVYRKGKVFGLPRNVFKSYREVLQAPKDWHWHFDLTLKTSLGEKVYFCHGKTSAHAKLSQSMSMSTVQGHFHERFEIIHWANPNGVFFDMRVGCLIDDDSLAFNYNNTNLKRPIIGCGLIIDGKPKLALMRLNKDGRWDKSIP